MTAMQAAFALAVLALLAPGVPAHASARRLLDDGAHSLSGRMQSWTLWGRGTWLVSYMLQTAARFCHPAKAHSSDDGCLAKITHG